MGRTANVTKNFGINILGQVVQLLIQFVSRTIFIASLSTEYLGVNGLFSNIFSLLSLTELGFGSALIYALYKPIAENDEKHITCLMNLYRKIYKIIALVVFVLGLLLLPFLDFFIAGETEIQHLNFIYILYLVNTASSYLFIYKKSLIDANQKNYITVIYQKVFILIQHILQIVVLLVWKSFYGYLFLQILFNILTNFAISCKADKMYPFISNDKKSLPESSETKAIFKNTYAMSLHKLGMILVNNTDNLLMSALISLKTVGIYSNYTLLINNVNVLVQMLFSSMTASVGNLCAKESVEKVKATYDKVNFLGFWIYSFCAVALICLLNPFIKLWVGERFLFNQKIVCIIVLSFFINGMRKATLTFRDALGLFWNDRYKAIAEALINLVVSFVCTTRFGVVGIFIGTITSSMLTSFWLEPYILYKHKFKVSVLDYFRRYTKYVIVMVALGTITFNITQTFNDSWVMFVLRVASVCVIYNIGIFVIFFHSKEMRSLYLQALGMMKNILSRRTK